MEFQKDMTPTGSTNYRTRGTFIRDSKGLYCKVNFKLSSVLFTSNFQISWDGNVKVTSYKYGNGKTRFTPQ